MNKGGSPISHSRPPSTQVLTGNLLVKPHGVLHLSLTLTCIKHTITHKITKQWDTNRYLFFYITLDYVTVHLHTVWHFFVLIFKIQACMKAKCDNVPSSSRIWILVYIQELQAKLIRGNKSENLIDVSVKQHRLNLILYLLLFHVFSVG